MGALISTIEGVPEVTPEGAPNYSLGNLHKDEQEGAFEFVLKGALEVSLELHLWLHLFVHSLIHKVSQNNSSHSGPDGSLEGAFDGARRCTLEFNLMKN